MTYQHRPPGRPPDRPKNNAPGWANSRGRKTVALSLKANYTDSVHHNGATCQDSAAFCSQNSTNEKAGTKAGQQTRKRDEQSPYYAHYNLVETICQLDPVDALLAQAERRLNHAADDIEWTRHFRIWRAIHELKTAANHREQNR